MKVWSPLEFFQKNMSHEQLLLTWSTFRDSSMGTKLKYFWKTHETVKSARICSQKMSHEKLPFMLSTFRDSSMDTKLKYFWKIHGTVKSILLAIATGNTFSIICFNVATMLTKMHLFRDCYTFCLCTCSEYTRSFVFWFTCAVTKPTVEQCSHQNGKHLLDW